MTVCCRLVRHPHKTTTFNPIRKNHRHPPVSLPREEEQIRVNLCRVPAAVFPAEEGVPRLERRGDAPTRHTRTVRRQGDNHGRPSMTPGYREALNPLDNLLLLETPTPWPAYHRPFRDPCRDEARPIRSRTVPRRAVCPRTLHNHLVPHRAVWEG